MDELIKEQEACAQRLFSLRRRIKDQSNIVDHLDYVGMDFTCGVYEEVDFDGLSDQDKFVLVVLIYEKRDYGVNSKAFKKVFGWAKEQVYKIAKNEEFLHAETLLSEDDGLLAGKGYVLDFRVAERVNQLYKEFLWHDISEAIPEHRILSFDIDIPNVYTGVVTGYVSGDGVFHVNPPKYERFENFANWPKEDNSWQLKETIPVDKRNVKRWKIIY